MRAFDIAVVVSCSALVACSSGNSVNDRISNVKVAGTRVGEAIYSDPSFEMLIVPLDAHGQSILEPGVSVQARITSPAGVAVQVLETSCLANRERQFLAAGIVIDDSSSMISNDPDDASGPAPARKAAVNQLVDSLQPGDVALVADFFGYGMTPLRDLVCVAASSGPPPDCIATTDSLTSDVQALKGAARMIANSAGTPLYTACQQMSRILNPQLERRKAMVVLSDGAPEDPVARAACLDAARSANVSIFTVGFGSGAEGPTPTCSATSACPTGWWCDSGRCHYDNSAVTAMRELAEATGGAYASCLSCATNSDQLAGMISNMAYSDGYCTVKLAITGTESLVAGTPVQGDVTAGAKGATARFEFLAPPRP